MIMRIQLILAALFLLTWYPVSNAEIVAKATTGEWKVSLIADGDPYDKNCRLDLVGETYQVKQKISLKQQGRRHSADTGCSLFGPIQIVASPAPDYKSTFVIVEAARGGDGDHTGPLLAIFQLTKSGFRQLAEKEIFDALYHRQNQVITSITGSVYFTFCDVCDGPSAGEYDFYVPARITFGCGSICFRPSINKADRTALIQRFNAQKAKVLEEEKKSAEYRLYLDRVQKNLNDFLAR